ncbi:hypothetical protein PMI22_05005 [Pseudomonas sp. GM21]|nr:hypothetical protein PMI22_05005 [Pseudomonas sp. GM21]
MRSINPYEIWHFLQRDSRLRNAPLSTLSHRTSIIGGGQ